jgi:oxaloacetate decarboxylase alpha subunit
VLNVLTGERYKSITKETAGVLKGEYGATAAPVNKELQARVLDGAEPVTCRPADNIAPELDTLSKELDELAEKKQLSLSDDKINDVLTYALFPQIGLKFIENRGNPDAFEPAPSAQESQSSSAPKPAQTNSAAPSDSTASQSIDAPLAGNVFKVLVRNGDSVSEGDVVMILEAMKMETEIRSAYTGTVTDITVSEGDAVTSGQPLILLG